MVTWLPCGTIEKHLHNCCEIASANPSDVVIQERIICHARWIGRRTYSRISSLPSGQPIVGVSECMYSEEGRIVWKDAVGFMCLVGNSLFLRTLMISCFAIYIWKPYWTIHNVGLYTIPWSLNKDVLCMCVCRIEHVTVCRWAICFYSWITACVHAFRSSLLKKRKWKTAGKKKCG